MEAPDTETSTDHRPTGPQPDVPDLERAAGGPVFTPRVKPYGWFGLFLSSVLIVLSGVCLFALVLGIVFATASLGFGWHEAYVRVINLKEALAADPRQAEVIMLGLGIWLYLAIAAMVFAAARIRGGSNWRDMIGWRRWRLGDTPHAVWWILAAAMLFSIAADAALAYFYPPSQNWNPAPSSIPAMVVFFILAVMAAPLTEELVFRGWLYTGLRARLGVAASLIVASALFALAHWESTHLYALTVFPVGLALGLLREKTGSLFASISFHAFYNSVAFVMMLAGK